MEYLKKLISLSDVSAKLDLHIRSKKKLIGQIATLLKRNRYCVINTFAHQKSKSKYTLHSN
jgi:hypothetical protein